MQLIIINALKNQNNSNFPNMKLSTYSRLTRDQARKYDSHLWRYNNSRHRGETIFSISPTENHQKLLHACDMLSCNISNNLIKSQSKWYIITTNISSFLIFCYYFTRLWTREISYNIWETRKIFPISRSTTCDKSEITKSRRNTKTLHKNYRITTA